MNEFDVIHKYFLPLAESRPEAMVLKDDAAIFNIPGNQELIVTSDISTAGMHFLENEKPANIARKALRRNLSDIAAMGADPYAYQLSIAFSNKPSALWLSAFSKALLSDQKKFGIFCSGGDTSRTKGPLCIAITAFGTVPKGKAVKRSGAKPGDILVITGPVGNAWIGLQILQNKIKNAKAPSCINAYQTPVPRIAVAPLIRKYASAAIDISDGLIADVKHICDASRCSAAVDLQKMKFSSAAQKFLDKKNVRETDLLSGGDDYELALAVPEKNVDRLLQGLCNAGLKPQAIGSFKKGKGVVVLKNGKPLHFPKSGWMHF